MALVEGKLYHSISEVSAHFNVATSLLRYWESEFSTINPKRNAKGTRFYTAHDIEEISRIYLLVKEKGYTLQGAKDKIKSDKNNVNKNVELIEKLQNIRSFLTKLKQEL
ncbi:MerR family transcriptional regulator [Bacteroidia bacterium]|nr:MerR family transcriptional regulator [Bacteroidia bacterium]MDB9881828.1 MerR family transcriptional regulator [Bacteroidia bacterium]MDC1395599.1 MerR family transcriptional regulator [Bacteroidia bacterium]